MNKYWPLTWTCEKQQLFEAFATSSALSGTKTRSQSTGHDFVNFEVIGSEKKNAVLVGFVEFRLSFRNQDTTSFKNTQKNFLLHRHFKQPRRRR